MCGRGIHFNILPFKVQYYLFLTFAEKSGYCPLVDPNQVGTCEIDCSEDSDCEGEKKCCGGPCGFGHCEAPLDIKPGK